MVDFKALLRGFIKPPVRPAPGSEGIEQRKKDSEIYKAVIPKFLYKPPFGYPRLINIPELRRIASMPYCEMAITTIIDEVSAVEWEIVPKEETAEQGHIDTVKDFFENPNQNKENLQTQFRKIIRDILTIDSGVWVKVFTRALKFSELYVRDGGVFTKNPDIFGTFRDKADIIPISTFLSNTGERYTPETENYLRQKAAYFQYGWTTGAMPIPFGKREIVYIMRNPQPHSIYGHSPIESLVDVLQSLIYGIEHNLEQFTKNTIPRGFIQMTGATTEDIEAFKKQWVEQMKTKDDVGNWRTDWYKIPVTGFDGKFVRLGWTNEELQIIQQQQWFSKLVWACMGVTPSELGYTESSNRATEFVQSKVFRRKVIRPLLNILQYHINTEIIPEFGFKDVKFQFNMYDVEEDLEKHRLYEIQIRNGIKTPNEIREELGLEPIPGGDEIRRTTTTFNPFEKREYEKLIEEQEKALTTTSPVVLKPFEEIDLTKLLKKILKQNKQKIHKKLDMYKGENKLAEIKALNQDIIKTITGAITIKTAGDIIKKVVRDEFLKGLEDAGKELDRNFLPDQRAVEFLQNHTFSNLADLDEEMKNDLRAELERGVLNGESISKLKERVDKVIDKGENRAEMIARTETIRASNQGRLAGYKQAGIKGKKVWVAKMDAKTCSICKELNNREAGLDENFEFKGGEVFLPPLHPRCRCRIIFKPE